ncbi:MAG TPA: hypothetical protein VEY51_12610 [Chondromyces sp.]|nr:hypothetical protein [Chondromyces sp.]
MRTYHLDPGYVTIPEATRIVTRMLCITNKDDRVHYKKILRGAKKGWFGGKMHGKRMFQVRRRDIIQYAEELLEAEKFNLFIFDFSTHSHKPSKFPVTTQEAGRQLNFTM